MTLHPVLERQLRKCGIAAETLSPAFLDLLGRVGRTYAEADQDRYTVERTMHELSREMQQLYEELRLRSDAIHEATLESSTDGVLIVDTDGSILSFNARFVEMWRIPPETAATRDFARMLEPGMRLMTDAAAVVARSEALVADPHAKGSDEIVLVDGRIIERHTAPIINAAGGLLGRGWFFRDVTELRRQQADLRAARDAAEDGARAKTAFLANMSHELRTPLNAILGFARILRRTDDEQRELLELIVNAGEHMLSLVNDLLDLRRIEDAAEPLATASLDLDSIVAEALSLVRPLTAEREHEVELRHVGDTPHGVEVTGDRRALLQILLNLLSNAAKFTPPRGRILVDVRLEAVEQRVRVSVTDNGVGIDEAGLRRLFTYYAQLNGKIDHGMKGSGIGLALTRALVRRNGGGDVVVTSEVGKGSTFSFTVPHAAAQNHGALAARSRPERQLCGFAADDPAQSRGERQRAQTTAREAEHV